MGVFDNFVRSLLNNFYTSTHLSNYKKIFHYFVNCILKDQFFLNGWIKDLRMIFKMAKIVKNDKVKKFWSKKFFLGRNRLRMFQNVFQTENLQIKHFSRVIFFLGLGHFLAIIDKIVKKQIKKVWSKTFLVSIDSECFKTYFKTKISKSKIFPC